MIEPHTIGEQHLNRRETGRLRLIDIFTRTFQWDGSAQNEMHDPERGSIRIRRRLRHRTPGQNGQKHNHCPA